MSYLNRNTPLARRGSSAKIEAKRRANYGTNRRHRWWYEQACTCSGLHPACSGGRSDPSHTRSKAVEGDENNIIAQSRGCHDFIGSQGWDRWEREIADLLGMHAPFVVEDERGYRWDRHAAAEAWSFRGPDAPGVTS